LLCETSVNQNAIFTGGPERFSVGLDGGYRHATYIDRAGDLEWLTRSSEGDENSLDA